MKACFILFTILSFIKFSLESSQWQVEFYQESETSPKKAFLARMGEYLLIKFKFVYPQNQPLPPQVKGSLVITMDSKLSQVPNEIMVNTIDNRLYSIYIGTSCFSQLLFDSDYTINFVLEKEDESKHIKWEPIAIRFENQKIPIAIELERNILEINSYSLYSVSFIRNIDELSIVLKPNPNDENIKSEEAYLPSYNPKARDQFKFYGRFGSVYSEGKLEYRVTPEIDGKTSNCFSIAPQSQSLSWKMSKTTIPEVFDKMPFVLNDTDADKSNQSTIRFHLKVDFKPVLISCGISSVGDMEMLTEDIVTHPFASADKTDNDFDISQTYHQVEGTAKMIFAKANRYSMGFTAVCYIQSLILINNEFKEETLRIVLSNSGDKDKTLTLKAEQPFPTQCIVWKFIERIDKKTFDSRIVPYCREYFSKEKSLKDKGCLVCESRETELFSDSEVGLCVRSDISCPIDYQGSIQGDFNVFINTINTNAKINQELSLQMPSIERVFHSSDDDIIDTSKLSVKVTKLNKDKIHLNIDSTLLNQTIQCFVKQIDKKPFVKVTEGDFELSPQFLNIVPWKTEYELSFTKEGFDNITYNIIAICYNFADYYYHSRHTDPFILFTFLRTNAAPVVVPSKEKIKCMNETVNPQCIELDIKELPRLKNEEYKPDITYELEDFARLNQAYEYLMLIDEYEEYLNVKVKTDIVDKTIYISELLSIMKCIEHTDYDYCRQLKQKYMTVLIDNYIKLFSSNDGLLKDIESISAQHWQDVPLIAIVLFDMTNNADSFTEASFNKLSAFMQEIVDKHNDIIDIIEKQKPASSLPDEINRNNELVSNAEQDFTYVLLLSHINFLDVSTFLEADQVASFNKTQSQTLNNTSIKQLYATIETLLPYFAIYEFKRVFYINFYLQIYNKYLQENSDEYFVYFDTFDVRVGIQKLDLFKANDVDFIFVFAIKKHPYLSHYASDYHTQTVSFRQYQMVDGKIVVSSREILDPNPIISYNMYGIDVDFTEAYCFDEENAIFVSKFSKIKLVTDNGMDYSHVIISKVGDYTFGKSKSSLTVWIIATLSIVGVILIIGVSYFLHSYFKKKKVDHPVKEVIQPIIEG